MVEFIGGGSVYRVPSIELADGFRLSTRPEIDMKPEMVTVELPRRVVVLANRVIAKFELSGGVPGAIGFVMKVLDDACVDGSRELRGS